MDHEVSKSSIGHVQNRALMLRWLFFVDMDDMHLLTVLLAWLLTSARKNTKNQQRYLQCADLRCTTHYTSSL